MNRRIIIMLVVLVVLGGTAAFLLRDKIALFSPRLAESIAKAGSSASPPPDKSKSNAPQPATPEELFPLAKSAKPLTRLPVFPHSKAPIVYVAPLKGRNDQITSAADTFNEMLRFHLRASPKSHLAINLVPAAYMNDVYYRQHGSNRMKEQKFETHVADAALLGADIAVGGYAVADTGPVPTVILQIADLRTSSVTQWDSRVAQPPYTTFPQVLTEAIKACARAVGLSDTAMEQAGMLKGIPSQATWQTCCTIGEDDDLKVSMALEEDPECAYLHEFAWNRAKPTLYVDRGLKRWPDDSRLLRRKALLLQDNKQPVAALTLLSELLNRHPDSMLCLNIAPEILMEAVERKSGAQEASETMMAMVDLMKQQARRYPNNWHLLWNCSNLMNRVALFMRGGDTVDKIPPEILEKFGNLANEAAQVMSLAAERRSDCPELLRATLYIHFHAGHTDPDWQRETIQRIHAVDPRNTQAEMYAAYSHSIGWGHPDDFWSFITDALKNHEGDAEAMHSISSTLGTEIRRRVSWKALTEDQAYKEPNPLTDQFVTCAEYAINHGIQVDKSVAQTLAHVYRKRHGEQKAAELYATGKSAIMTAGAAKQALDSGDWSTCLKLARLSLPNIKSDDERHLLRYYIVKSLWKLKQYDESLAEAKKGISEFPEKQTFHYMFAVVADEKGGMTQEAYTAAYDAIVISTTNDGTNTLFEKLRTALGKPEHPMLKK